MISSSFAWFTVLSMSYLNLLTTLTAKFEILTVGITREPLTADDKRQRLLLLLGPFLLIRN